MSYKLIEFKCPYYIFQTEMKTIFTNELNL